jgi:hypothetical protein
MIDPKKSAKNVRVFAVRTLKIQHLLTKNRPKMAGFLANLQDGASG